MDRNVVIKEILPELAANPSQAENAIGRFRREARITGQMRDPHVVQAYQFVEAGGKFYLVMEYVDGKPLDKLVKPGAGLPLKEVLRITTEVASGLSHAHQRGIIHRDIKPGNIMQEHKTGLVRILDWGLAKLVKSSEPDIVADQTRTQSGVALGTPLTMPPEQSCGNADARSDLYALGCVMHYLLTGRYPYQGATGVATLMAHINNPIPDLTQVSVSTAPVGKGKKTPQ
jgi:serine/threonine-protein kinase